MKEAFVNIKYCPLIDRCKAGVFEGHPWIGPFDGFCPIYNAAKDAIEGLGYKWDMTLKPKVDNTEFHSEEGIGYGSDDKEGMILLSLSRFEPTHICGCKANIGSPNEKTEAKTILNAMRLARYRKLLMKRPEDKREERLYATLLV